MDTGRKRRSTTQPLWDEKGIISRLVDVSQETVASAVGCRTPDGVLRYTDSARSIFFYDTVNWEIYSGSED